MLHFRPEWQEAPGIKDKVLARTWARLEIRADDVLERLWPSNAISRVDSIQRGVYTSVFSLAEWLVENWWFVLYESCRVPELPSGRTLAQDTHQRAWVQRHNLLAAREGGALPDLALYRDGRDVVAQWFPDPQLEETQRPARFFTAGKIRTDPEKIEQALQRLVEEVLARLEGFTDEDSLRLRRNWEALCESRHTERDLCAWAAQLGADPYDPAELTDDLVAIIESQVTRLDEHLRSDLLQASVPGSLPSDLDWVNQAMRHAGLEPSAPSSDAGASWASSNGVASAHALGYRLAERFRTETGWPLAPVDDVAALLAAKCGWTSEPEIEVEADAGDRLAALVGKDKHGIPHLVGPRLSHSAERFRLVRGLYFLHCSARAAPPRLVTRAYTWDQRASRAFAAELLAPAQALRAEVHDGVPHARIDELAAKFQVSSWVIEHQLTNHRIGWTEEF